MIDLHSHILPGLDDGSNNIAETLGMVSQLYEAGFKTLIATPHVIEGRTFLSPAEILATTEQVRQAVAEAGIPVEILPGAENYIFPDLAKYARDGKLMTLGNAGKYLLVEFPMLEIPHYTDQVFFELQVLGITPVLAHPERNKGLVDEPERLVEWARKGVLFQLNLRSLSGHYGPQAKQLAEILLSSELIHFIGSDTHRVSRSDATYSEGLQTVQDVVGETSYQDLTRLNPQTMLEGKPLQQNDQDYELKRPVAKKKRSWVRKLLGG
ncbi:MAG TPA: CpsB/CapC family capsule biosynthesis tyrosine phosphatase [Desulfosporosinus sp.]|nr:CpsB/CapC family capsule biosynthesis tyrosine phosphatase [Desulfosporosinus sp.]